VRHCRDARRRSLVISVEGPVSTDGERDPRADAVPRLDESLLNQGDVALGAQAAMARRTAAQRVARAERLKAQAASRRRRDAAAPPGGPWGVRAQLPRDATCGAVARRLMDEYVHDHLDARAACDALLVTTELATNAFVHGSGSITLRIERLSDRLRIEVLDEGQPRRIEPGSPSSTSRGGRGLRMVDELSLAWGALERTGHVWAEVPVR